MPTTTERVTAVVLAFSDAWNRHDMEAFGQLFAADAEFVNVVGIWWKGRAEIQAAHEFTHATMFKNSRMTMESTEVRFPATSMAIARSTWTLEGHQTSDGKALPPRMGVLVNVLQQTPEGWKIIDSQNTDIVEGELTRPQ